ncbi:MAG: DUF4349 domain-containing protein [Actinomycetota bacterium]
MQKKFLLLLVALAVIASLLFAGCSALSPQMEEAEKSYAPEEAAMSEAEDEAAPAEATAEAGEADYSNIPEMERKVIKTAYLELEIDTATFEDKLFKVSRLAEQNGGFVTNSESYSDSEGKLTSGRITVRVPAGKFDFMLDEIKSLGTIQSINISGQDVTEEYIDLESRLKNLQKQEEVLLGLMEQSKSVEDSIEVQRELSYVQEEIEVIKGRMNYIDDRVDFSTIEVYLSEPSTIKTSQDWGFLDALKQGVRSAVRVLNGLITGLIAISPVLVFIAIIGVIIWAIIRARKRRRAKKE